jgi:hypothetical protein
MKYPYIGKARNKIRVLFTREQSGILLTDPLKRYPKRIGLNSLNYWNEIAFTDEKDG